VSTPVRPVRQQNAVSDFFTGTGLLFRGIGLVARRPRLLALGLVPGIIALIVVATALGTLFYFISDVAAAVTWFAHDWSKEARDAIRLVAAVAIGLVSVIVAVLTFTALTITIGDPFYESISKRIDDQFGGAREADIPWHRTLVWNLLDSLRLVAMSVVVSVVLFLLGLVPAVGQTVVPVIGWFIGGWLLAVEISGVPFNRRGMRLRERRRLLRANRALALGFGVPIFLIFLVPFVAVLVMPGAVAGATLMTRRVLGQRYE
jgi:CysZ protein